MKEVGILDPNTNLSFMFAVKAQRWMFSSGVEIVATSVIVLTAASCCFPQVKNIIYHAVKDAVGTLKAHEPKLARP